MHSYTSKLQLKSHLLDNDFVPDGDLNKACWKTATWTQFDHDWAGKHCYPRAETRVASRWTSSQAYFAFECRYSLLNIYKGEDTTRKKWGLWERDVVEVFVNPQPAQVDHYYEFEVAPNNLWIDLEIDLQRKPFNDASWNSYFTHATRIGKRHWTCEMRIPASAMTPPSYAITAGAEWRGNFFRADGRGDDSKRRLLAWSPTLTLADFHVPTRFGLIRFVR